MLTPKELLQTDFRVTLRGYNQKDVDNFVRKVVQAYEGLTRRNKELSELLEQAEATIGTLREDEERSTEMLRLAQENAVDMKVRAEKQAKQIVEDAEAQAEEILAKARKLELEAIARVERIREEERAIRAAWRRLLEGALLRLDETEPDDDEIVPTAGLMPEREFAPAAAATENEDEASEAGDDGTTDELQGAL